MLEMGWFAIPRHKTNFMKIGAETNEDDCHAGNRGQGDEGIEYLTTEARHELSLSYFRQCPAFRASFGCGAKVVAAVRAGRFAVIFMLNAAASGRFPSDNQHGK